MSYLVLARKYRPGTFASLSGQTHVARTLTNAIEQERIAHAYLFAGPRGVGKTSVARIFAKCLNCEKGLSTEPCQECSSCKEVASGSNIAVREIDGASHNSVDNVRDLIDSFRALPPPGARYKVYIIDEVHMLSSAAFNALLKSLEEPPPNTVFILATTEAHKIPETVISRCQRYDFRALEVAEIEERIKQIALSESIDIEPAAIRLLARMSDGSMRDSQSLLERVRTFSEDSISESDVSSALGTVEWATLFTLCSAILSGESADALDVIDRSFSTGVDPAIFLREFSSFWREILVTVFDAGGSNRLSEKLGLSADQLEQLKDVLSDQDPLDTQDLVKLALDGADHALRSSYPRYSFEALVVRMCTREKVKDLGEILGKMRTLLKKSGGQTRQKSSNASTSPVNRVRQEEAHPNAGYPEASVSAKVPAVEVELSTNQSVAVSSVASWESFVTEVAKSGSPILIEHFRRLMVEEFSNGTLRGRGPEFSVRYLNREENMEKFKSLLSKHTDHSRWNVQLSVGGGETKTEEPGSMLHKAKVEQETKELEERERLDQHPQVQSFKKMFPGSTIEGIRKKKTV